MVIDSVRFQIIPTLPIVPILPAVPRGPGDWPRFLGAIIPCTDDNRISQREPLTSACDQLVLNQEYGNDSDDVITIFIIKLRLTMARQWDSLVRRGPQASFLDSELLLDPNRMVS